LKQCVYKTKITIALAQTTNPLIYELIVSCSFPNFEQNVKNHSLITITSFDSKDYNYSLTPKNSIETQKFLITLSTLKDFVNGPLLIYTFNISDYFLLQNNFYLPIRTTSLKLNEYHVSKLAVSINSQISSSQTITQGAGSASTLFASSSGLFIQGIMLSDMIFLLKYIDINYPANVRQMFDSESKKATLIFHFDFIDKDKDSQVMPLLFQHYKVSVYFLNNVGEALCQILAIALISYFFLLITPSEISEKKVGTLLKILIYIRNALVWETTLFYIMMNLQRLIFFVTCSWMFPPLNSVNSLINLSIATVFGFFISLWLLHLLEKINVCQCLKTKNLLNETADKIEIEQNGEKYNESQNLSVLNSPPTEFNSPKMKDKGFLPTQATIFKKNDYKISSELGKHKNFEALDSRNQSNLENFPLKNTSEKNVKSFSVIQNNLKFLEKLKKIFSTSFLVKFLFQPKNPIVFLRRYEILHLEYKSQRSIHKYYAFFLLMRQSFLSIAAVVLHFYPLIQIISINVLNLIFVGYSIFSKPFMHSYCFIVCAVDELITEVAFFSAFLIALYDYLEIEEYESRIDLGWAIILANLILLYWVLSTGLLKPIVFAMIEFRKKRNELKKIHCISNK